MPRGGKRPGSGRKPGTNGVEKEEARALLRRIVIANMTPLVESQVANAKGIKYLVVRDTKSGRFLRRIEDPAHFDQALSSEQEYLEVWAKDPSVQAFTDLMNRTIDKPTEHVEADVQGDLRIKWEGDGDSR